MKDVAVAGVRGFEASHTVNTTYKYHVGGHGRPLDDDHLPLIAQFLDGTAVPPPQLSTKPAWWLGWPSRLMNHPVVAYAALLAVSAALLIPLYWWLGLPLMIAVALVALAVVAVVFDTV
jgi:hypothetical protein